MQTTPRPASSESLSGVLMVLAGSVLLSAKGIYAKLLYAQGMDFITVMSVRGALAMPFFVAWGCLESGLAPLRGADRRVIGVTLLAGLVSFYVGGVVDFYALTLIDANLERVLLFTYPAMIVVALAIRRRQWPGMNVAGGLLLTTVGIVLAIGGLDAGLWQANTLGAALVLLCAVFYAGYYFANEYAGNRIGTRAFVFVVTTSATLAIWLHFLWMHDLSDIHIPGQAWWLLAMFTVGTTVAPTLLLAEGVRRIGAQRGALLSTVGPPSTILLAAAFLGERLAWFQFVGMAAVLAGIVLLERRNPVPAPVRD